MKKTRVWPALLAALVILAGCAAAPPEESDPPTEEFVFTRENMPRLNGSTSAVPLAEAVCSVLLGESREEVADLVQFSRTTASYEALMAGEDDLLLAGEPEQAVMERLEAGDRWLLTPFASDALVFVVNADKPVDRLSTEQLQKFYSGEITNWSEVGGADGEIACIGREANSGTRDGFESITGTEDTCKLSQELTSTGAVIEAVKNSPNAIGYASLSAVEGKEGIKALTVNGVACSEETVLDGSYEIQRPFVLVTKSDASLSTAAQAFFDYAPSKDASALIRNAGAVPVAE